MEKQVRPGLRTVFLVHSVVGLVFGLSMLFAPEWLGDLTNWPVQDVAVYRLMGGAMLGYAASSILAYRENIWEKVIIIIRTEIVWTALATLIFVWAVLFGGAPAIAWLYALLMAGFCVAFSLFYNPA